MVHIRVMGGGERLGDGWRHLSGSGVGGGGISGGGRTSNNGGGGSGGALFCLVF